MRTTNRIIDANVNRASEGLRTLEDIARFVLDDAAISGKLKEHRHTLRSSAAGVLTVGGLVAGRDTPGDVGTGVRTAGEAHRADWSGVARAAAARTQEALRVIEEAAKVRGAAAAPFDMIRYAVYDLERELLLRLGPACPQWRLCVLLTESICRRPWLEVAERAIRGGADCLQLREKDMESGELLSRARQLVSLARSLGRATAVIINDRPDIAALAGADGVHVGQHDLAPVDARTIMGERAIVGVSTASLDQAHAAVRAGASYCGLGPMFPSSTKPKDVLAGPEYAAAYLADERTAGVPHLAISGITAANVGTLASAGVRGVAVSGEVCGADDPEAACRRLLAGLGADGR